MSRSLFTESLERGVAAHQAGKLDEALKSYRAALKIQPNDAEASSLCGLALLHGGEAAEAMPLLQHAVAQEPEQVGFRLNLAEGLAQTGKPEAAMAELRRILARVPTNAVALSRLHGLESEALLAARDWARLYASALAWTKADLGATAAWRALARAAFEDGLLIEAIRAFERALALSKPTAADLTAYAGLCLQALDFDAASRALDQAEALDPNFAQMLASRALVLMYLGHFEEAEASCARAIQQAPDFVPAYSTLSRLRRGALQDAHVRTLQGLARRPDVDLDHRIPAMFAIAHAHDARGDAAAAFAAYEEAHQLALERDALEKRTYDPAQDAARLQRIVDLSSKAPDIAPLSDAPRPIFVVGMPRSGTTLIESMLGAHSRVFPCGERPAMRQVLSMLLDLERAPDESILQDCAKLYFRDLPNIGRAEHVTDKHPRNYEAAGLIARLLPNAMILNVRRNPAETCLSIYRQEFNKHWTFTHRLTDIAEHYVRYAELAAYWERTLPGRFLTIQYEDFVADFANAAPRLVEACRLAWEPQCLEYQKSTRAIATFSTVQARAPVASGNGRARLYEKHLAPLVAALEAAGVDLETGALKGSPRDDRDR
ncbi:MAG: sulfotransferase [Hyphomonadaceae bacterium]|nr:sulfotransferase [Hyphomonadaceae bacterium]